MSNISEYNARLSSVTRLANVRKAAPKLQTGLRAPTITTTVPVDAPTGTPLLTPSASPANTAENSTKTTDAFRGYKALSVAPNQYENLPEFVIEEVIYSLYDREELLAEAVVEVTNANIDGP